MSAIDLQSLTKIFTQRNKPLFKAVDDLTLSIPKGQIFGFLGPNGAGKTTTIKMICKLITPTHGSISLNGYNISHNRNKVVQQVGAVLEGARNIYWQLSAWQNLIYFGQLKGITGKVLYGRVEYLLRGLELWHRKDESVGNFSRGMQQKVAIACALIANPPIILLDEPTLGLDIQASRTLQTWIEQLAHEEQKTIILTTHQLDIAEKLCDRIAIMDQGKLITDKAKKELLELFHQEHYQIVIAGPPGTSVSLFPDMNIVQTEAETIFSGAIANQDDLYQRLNTLRAMQVPLVAVNRAKYNLEDIFLQLTQNKIQPRALES